MACLALKSVRIRKYELREGEKRDALGRRPFTRGYPKLAQRRKVREIDLGEEERPVFHLSGLGVAAVN